MADTAPSYPTRLFTRQQLVELTGVDSATLDYWSREGVLRPAEGGGGKGQHRRYYYTEVNLAAVLAQLGDFGVKLPALKGLAQNFHDGLDYMGAIGISRLEERRSEALSSLMTLRGTIEEHGFQSLMVRADEEDQFPGIKLYDGEYYPGGPKVARLNWDEGVAWLRRGFAAEEYTDELVTLAASLDPADYDRHHRYWSFISHINFRKPDEGHFSTDASYFYRDADRAWYLAFESADAARASITFIGIDMDRLTYRIWVEGR